MILFDGMYERNGEMAEYPKLQNENILKRGMTNALKYEMTNMPKGG